MLEDVMSEEMFDNFTYERMELVEQSEHYIEIFNSCMKSITENLHNLINPCGKLCYLAGLRDGQAIAQQKGGLPTQETTALETSQS